MNYQNRNVQLRSQPIATLSYQDAERILKEKGFFDRNWNEQGKGFQHQYEVIENQGQKLIIDHTTSLMWQQAGSLEDDTTHDDAKKYVRNLNSEKFGGYSDWRLPALEEAMSLMESEQKNGRLYIDPKFDKRQSYIWTADERSTGFPWYVSFMDGFCMSDSVPGGYNLVRAVRGGVKNSKMSSSGCFIATAAYGSPLAPEVLMFRCFRDDILVKTKLGMAIVRIYYFCSPPLASLISQSGFLRLLTRNVLKYIVCYIQRWLKTIEN